MIASLPLSGLRMAVTLPPLHFFGGVDYNFAVEMTAELRRLGANVFELDTEGFHFRNDHYVQGAIEALRAFAPDVAIGLPNANYAFMCRDSGQRNVFSDVLEIPTVMLWDQGLLQLPKLCLEPLPDSPADGRRGAIERMRQLLNHPLYHHYSPDSGHIEALDRLGIISRERVRFFFQPAYPNFVNYGHLQPPAGAFRTPLAFAGNVYLEASCGLLSGQDPQIRAIEEHVMTEKKRRLTVPLWDLFVERIGTLEPPDRERLELVPDSTFFWSLLHDEIEVLGHTEIRLHVLGSLDREYEFFGNFIEPNAWAILRRQRGIRLRRSLDYFTELPLLFMNSDVVVDVVSLGFNSGVSTKVMGCLACGGLMLFDYKSDFHSSMGDVGAMVMYRDLNELNALVDRYLTDSRQRWEVVRYLKHRASTMYSFASLCRRLMVDEPLWQQ